MKRNQMYKNKRNSAFTMLEMVVIIVVIGIIASALLPRIDDSSNIRNAANQLVSDIRYTQHLAMSDDQISTNDKKWYKKRWTIIFNNDRFTDGELAYTIFADVAGKSTGNPDATSEIAKNPLDHDRVLSGGYSGIGGLDIRDLDSFIGTKRYNLGKTYGIKKIEFSQSCSFHNSKRIAFDHMGRPLKGNISSYKSPYPSASRVIKEQCTITLYDNNDRNVSIYVEPETGYAHL